MIVAQMQDINISNNHFLLLLFHDVSSQQPFLQVEKREEELTDG
jgi:hypothetical protein